MHFVHNASSSEVIMVTCVTFSIHYIKTHCWDGSSLSFKEANNLWESIPQSQMCMEDFSGSTLLRQSLALKSEKALHSVGFPGLGAGRTCIEVHCPGSRLHSRGRCSGGVQTDQIGPPWWGVCTGQSQLARHHEECVASVHSLPSGRSGPGWWPGHWSL